MQNRPRPSIAQNSRNARQKPSEATDGGKVQLKLPGKSAESAPKQAFGLKSPEPAKPAPPVEPAIEPAIAPADPAPTPGAAVLAPAAPAPVASAPVVVAPAAPAPAATPLPAPIPIPVVASAPLESPAPAAAILSPTDPLLDDAGFQLPAGFKPRTKQGTERSLNTRNTSGGKGLRSLTFPVLLLVGGLVGYLIGSKSHPAPPPVFVASKGAPAPADAPVTDIKPITAEQQAALDDAFEAAKAAKYDTARVQMVALLEKRPEWTSLRFEIARLALYQRNYVECEKLIRAGENNGDISVADGEFLLALQHMTNKRYPLANKGYERAAAADPARADIYYFWGECLRRQGKPGEASAKLRAALARNQYETSDTLYQLKLWLSEIQSGEEVSTGLAAELDAEMAKPAPSSAVLLASAAREIKVSHFPQAAALVTRARQVLDSPVFSVVIQDPTFSQESWRPEFVGFYPKPVAPPAASPTPESKVPDAKPDVKTPVDAKPDVKTPAAKGTVAPGASAVPVASPERTLSIKTLDPKAEVPPPLSQPELEGQVPPKP